MGMGIGNSGIGKKMGMGIGFYHGNGNGNGFMGMGGNGNRNSPSRTPLVPTRGTSFYLTSPLHRHSRSSGSLSRLSCFVVAHIRTYAFDTLLTRSLKMLTIKAALNVMITVLLLLLLMMTIMMVMMMMMLV